MRGSAVPTMVWSRAPRKSASMTAPRISSLARWLRPRAGSSAREGVRAPAQPGTLPWVSQSLPCVRGRLRGGGSAAWVRIVGFDGGRGAPRSRSATPPSLWVGVDAAERPTQISSRRASDLARASPARPRRGLGPATTRRSSGTRVRSMKPRSSIRSIRPVALETETFSTSASRLMVISPLRWTVYMMWSWAMLTPWRSSRSLDAHLSWLIVARKSAMMVLGRVGPFGLGRRRSARQR